MTRATSIRPGSKDTRPSALPPARRRRTSSSSVSRSSASRSARKSKSPARTSSSDFRPSYARHPSAVPPAANEHSNGRGHGGDDDEHPHVGIAEAVDLVREDGNEAQPKRRSYRSHDE